MEQPCPWTQAQQLGRWSLGSCQLLSACSGQETVWDLQLFFLEADPSWQHSNLRVASGGLCLSLKWPRPAKAAVSKSSHMGAAFPLCLVAVLPATSVPTDRFNPVTLGTERRLPNEKRELLVIHIHLSILFQILFPFRLLQNTEQNFLSYTLGLSGYLLYI